MVIRCKRCARALALALAIVAPVPAGAQGFEVLVGANAGLAVADTAITLKGLRDHPVALREANPLLRPLAGKPAVFAVVRLGGEAALLTWAHQLHKRRPKAAVVVLAVWAATKVAVVGWNVRMLRRQQNGGGEWQALAKR